MIVFLTAELKLILNTALMATHVLCDSRK